MKNIVIAAIAAFMAFPALDAKTIDRMQVENGGPGPYKAEIVLDDGLEGYTIIKPVDMKSAAAVEGRLPVILFGNGGCARSSWGFHAFLTNIASRGYVVVTNGNFQKENPFVRTAPAPRQEGEAAQPQAQSQADMMEGFRKAEAQNVADAKDYLRALDYLAAQAANKKSEYYNLIDTGNVAAMGQSCGGGQALILGTCGDSRIKTTVALNSGVAYLDETTTWMLTKEDLQNLSGPTVYIIGGPSDVAYKNAADDFTRIEKVPVAVANLPVGHGGTYSQEHGGSFADMTILWLDCYLKGKTENEAVFRYGEMPAYLEQEGWTMHSKNWSKPFELHLWEPVASTETRKYNDFGELSQSGAVNDPTMTVFLPDPAIANGTAVLIYPGGGMMSLTMDGEGSEVARWLNARGIAAMVVKYRLRDMSASRPSGPRPAAPAADQAAPASRFLRMQGRIQDFGELVNANCSPSVPDPNDKSTENSAADANRAYEIVKAHAAEWGIDPSKIGTLGFSAGGCVELAGLMAADDEHIPAFMGSVYGPANVDVVVKPNFPRLFIAVHADHPNVAAGCLALFLEWKKAGLNAEMHVFDKNTGNFFGSGNSGAYHPLGGDWKDSFYAWLLANDFVNSNTEKLK